MNDAKQASPAFGGFLILPLKYDPDRLGRARLEALGEPAPVTTADVNENIKAMFDPASPASVGWGRVLPRQALWASLGGGRAGALKVGFSVGKKLGCAVRRNRVKRRLRAACAPLLPRMKKGLYVFIARQPAAEADFDRLCRTVYNLLRKQNLLLPEPPEHTATRKAGGLT